MVDNDDRIAVSLDVRQPFVQDAPAKQIDGQTLFGGGRSKAPFKPGWSASIGRPSRMRMRMPRAPGVAAHFATTSSIAGLVTSTGVTTRNLSG